MSLSQFPMHNAVLSSDSETLNSSFNSTIRNLLTFSPFGRSGRTVVNLYCNLLLKKIIKQKIGSSFKHFLESSSVD